MGVNERVLMVKRNRLGQKYVIKKLKISDNKTRLLVLVLCHEFNYKQSKLDSISSSILECNN